jgi:predicted RNA-binding Zn ribbon-like protein
MTSKKIMVVTQGRQSMDEATWRTLGETVEPGLREQAPVGLRLVQRYLNTWNHEFPSEWDRLGSGRKATRWLAATGLIGSGETVNDRGAERLRAFRDALRTTVGRDARSRRSAVRALANVSDVCVKVRVGPGGRTELEAAQDGAEGAIARLLISVHEAQLTGDWQRLKACRQCGWAFYDRSKNRSSAWCAMSICGNRIKNRSYRRRRAVPG